MSLELPIRKYLKILGKYFNMRKITEMFLIYRINFTVNNELCRVPKISGNIKFCISLFYCLAISLNVSLRYVN